MYNIKYYYSSLAKQSFLIIFIAYTIARIGIFHVAGFSEFYYPILSTVMYLAIILLCFFLLNAFKYYTVEFTETDITIKNLILRKSRCLKISDVKKAEFTRLGIKLYTDDMSKASVIIPIYFFGKMSPVGCENFEIMLKNMKVPEVTKTFKVLPGYGRISIIIGYFFFFSCIPFLLSTIELFQIIFILIQS